MTEYKVTTELATSRWKKILRWFRIIKSREEFKIVLVYSHFNVGDVLDTGGKGSYAKILSKQKYGE